MIIATTQGVVEVCAKTTTSLDRVILTSRDFNLLEGIVASIELAGASEDIGDVGTWDEIIWDENTGLYNLELDRTTFKIWFEFEVDGYLRYGKNEFEKMIEDEDHREIIQKMKENI